MNRVGRYCLLVLFAGLGLFFIGCGGSGETGNLQVGIYGWAPTNAGGSSFTAGLPRFQGGNTVSASVTKPASGQQIGTAQTSISNQKVTLPGVSTGSNLRMDVAVVNQQSEVVGFGATPMFDYKNQNRVTFSVMMTPVGAYAPVGNLALTNSQGAGVVRSKFDSSATSSGTLRLAGHGVATFDRGNKVLLVGGAVLSEPRQPGALPSMTDSYNGIQIFDVSSSSFESLSNYQTSGDSSVNETLQWGTAYPSVTKVGDQKFVIAGGVSLRADQASPLDDIYVLDLAKEPGNRLTTMSSGATDTTLTTERVFHTATYFPSKRAILIAGGLSGTPSDAVAAVDRINVDNQTVQSIGQMNTPRAEHSVIPLGGNEFAVIGGHDGEQALSSAARVSLNSEWQIQIAAQGELNQARHNVESFSLNTSAGRRLLVIGGFGGINGEPLASWELIRPSDMRSFSQTSWRLSTERGGPDAVRLQPSGSILVFGGRSGSGMNTGGERMTFDGIGESPPFSSAPFDSSSNESRAQARATLLSSGKVLLTGGINTSSSQTLDNAEFYTPRNPIAGAQPNE